jgi:hypothetical protein
MDRKSQKKKDREKEVRKKVLKKRMHTRNIQKEFDLQDKLIRDTRVRKSPIVKTGNHVEDNMAVLEQKLQEHDDFIKQREETKKQIKEKNDESDN